jgi:hypothetical protein
MATRIKLSRWRRGGFASPHRGKATSPQMGHFLLDTQSCAGGRCAPRSDGAAACLSPNGRKRFGCSSTLPPSPSQKKFVMIVRGASIMRQARWMRDVPDLTLACRTTSKPLTPPCRQRIRTAAADSRRLAWPVVSASDRARCLPARGQCTPGLARQFLLMAIASSPSLTRRRPFPRGAAVDGVRRRQILKMNVMAGLDPATHHARVCGHE